MRIIAGSYRSRLLQAPPGSATRPTSDRLRETLFNVLAPRIEGARLLDLYAGSGAVGIEALSRGAAQAVFVERAAAAVKVLRTNLERLGIGDGFRVDVRSTAEFLHGPRTGAMEFDIVFLDPPWDAEEEYEKTLGFFGGTSIDPRSQTRDLGHPALSSGWLAEGATVIAEHRRKERLEDAYGALRRTRLLEQGDAALSFYEEG